MTTLSWLIGLAVALVGGGVVAGLVMSCYHKSRFSDGLVMGIMERTFFVVGVAFNLPGIGVAMVAWIAAKMVAGWNRESDVKQDRMTAMKANLMSMFFAAIGGLIARGDIG